MNDAFTASERRHLTEPDDDRCERCGDPSYGGQYCARCEDAINDELWGEINE